MCAILQSRTVLEPYCSKPADIRLGCRWKVWGCLYYTIPVCRGHLGPPFHQRKYAPSPCPIPIGVDLEGDPECSIPRNKGSVHERIFALLWKLFLNCRKVLVNRWVVVINIPLVYFLLRPGEMALQRNPLSKNLFSSG
jgi:hypothetical protein